MYTVKDEENKSYDCVLRGKFRNQKVTPVVGDKVLFDKDELVINEIEERVNCLERPPVSNIDIGLIVTSVKLPDINMMLLDKLISVITINKITPVICFTKLDLLNNEEKKNIKNLTKYYSKIGIKVVTNKNKRKIKKILKNKIVVVCGQTGAGKSTLINKLNRNLNLDTNEISLALGRGKHTTRIVELFDMKDFYIVDTPGFSALELNEYTREQIKDSFIEFRNSGCKYKDCNHINESNCVVREKVGNGTILKSRYDNYLKLMGDK